MKQDSICVLISLMLSGLLGLASTSLAAESPWVRKADMPTPRQFFAACTVNGKIYAIGGVNMSYSICSVVEEYDPVTDTWIKKSDMPTPRGWISTSAAAVNGKIYVIGGWLSGATSSTSTVEEYDPVTDTWTRKADMPTSRGALATAEVNGKIYAIGGGPASGSFLPVVEEYDPVTNTWIKKSNLIAARNAFSANVVNGEIYAIGGYAGVEISTVEKYDALLAPRRPPQGVDSKGKLATLWGRLKASN